MSQGESIFSVTPEMLKRLSSKLAVEVFRDLLWAQARKKNVPITRIRVTSEITTADGGIDASVDDDCLHASDDILVAGGTRFQIKTGNAKPWQKSWLKKELFGSARISKGSLGEAVRRCLQNRGRYIIVCFGCSPGENQINRAKKHLGEYFAKCGFPKSNVDVWGQSQIIGLLSSYPSLCLNVAGRAGLEFLSHSDWALDHEMSLPLKLGPAQTQLIDEVRTCLRGSAIRHIRLVGEPGLGKTRLILEATRAEDVAPLIIYVRHAEQFQQSRLFNLILRPDNHFYAVIVVDECSANDRASIWNALRQRCDRIRLITLDHGPESAVDDLMRVINCPVLGIEQIKGILEEYIGNNGDLQRWAEYCSGSPRVAHAVGNNLKRNPNDILQSPASVPIWERFIHGNSRSDSQEAGQHEVVLRHIALFQKFGFGIPVAEESRFISTMVEKADPNITWPRFQSIIKHFRDRRILQGQTTLFLVPKALHIYLWLQFWKHYGTGTDIADLLSSLPKSLIRWFCEMFRYGFGSEGCRKQVECLMSQGGPFDDRDFVNGAGSVFLNELAEADPEATLKCIERTVGSWSREDLLQFRATRQYLVWALEKIAIWSDLFQRAAKMLLMLAVNENAGVSNNATGTFCGLFSMGHGVMASSEAKPSERLPVLQSALSDPCTRAIGLKAAFAALSEHPFSKGVGPTWQGIRPLPALWTPKTLDEVCDAYRSVWQMLIAHWRATSDDERISTTKLIIESAFWLVQQRFMDSELIPGLRELSADPLTDPRAIVQLVSRFRWLNWQNLSRDMAQALRSLDRKITGVTLKSKIRRFVLYSNYDDSERPSDGNAHAKHLANLRKLAKSALRKSKGFKEILPQISSEPGFATASFGTAIAEEDAALRWMPSIIDEFKKAGQKQNPSLMLGYLFAVFQRDVTLWEVCAEKILNDVALQKLSAQLVLRTGLTDRILGRLCADIDADILPAASITGIGYGWNNQNFTLERRFEFLSWCLDHDSEELKSIALHMAYSIFCMGENCPQLPEHLVLRLLTSKNVLICDATHHVDYEWAKLADRFLLTYPQHAICILDSFIRQFDEFSFSSRSGYSAAHITAIEILKKHPQASWASITNYLSVLNEPRARHLLQWLGGEFGQGAFCPLVVLDVNDVIAWIDLEPNERAYAIASECPKTLSPTEGGRLTREVLIRYGNQPIVRGALSSNFGSNFIAGKPSNFHRQQRDNFRKWRSGESAPQVLDFIDEFITRLGARINVDEIREEREY